jgi:drug/metabolite transporter (DMT)-like permease
MSVSPILVIPVVLARGEKVGWAGVVGAMLAVGGVALLALA